MKTLLKVFLISSILFACKNAGEKKTTKDVDSMGAAIPPVGSAKKADSKGPATASAEDVAAETRRQAAAALLGSKQEINVLRSQLSDSLSKAGLPSQKRVLFSKTVQQLEATSDVVDKQLEQIMVTDLQNSREKLGALVKKMKDSEQELGTLIARIDRISDYLTVATNLIQTLSPVKPGPAAKK